MPAGTPLNKEAPIQAKRRKTKTDTSWIGNAGARPIYDHQSWETIKGEGGSSWRISSRCRLVRSNSKQIPGSGFVMEKDLKGENYFDITPEMVCLPCAAMRPIKFKNHLSDSTNQIPTSGSEGDSMREVKEKKREVSPSRSTKLEIRFTWVCWLTLVLLHTWYQKVCLTYR